MKLLYPTVCILILASTMIWAASSEESDEEENEEEAATTEKAKTEMQQQHQHQHQGIRLISFDTVDKDIAIGLDYLLPFVKVPVKRKRNAPPRPLVIVNSAAILSCGLVAAGGAFAGYLLRSMGLETVAPDLKKEESEPKQEARGLLDGEAGMLQLFENFKLIYNNSSGQRVETTLPSFLETVEHGFQDQDINLPVCLLKSICSLTHKATRNARAGQASELELLLDGATSWSWLLSWLEQSTLREAIEAGRVSAGHYCAVKYPRCKWTAPDEQLLELLSNNVQFT
ncbi:hypothetical protein KR222_007854 [Zaprionus bogoriensis]|nr:hypothetical protein KR222_007854 [Zaprionus bogoriensis]